ncbi:MAG TPA: hypothetical protein V6C69_06515 [Trichormus sp.]
MAFETQHARASDDAHLGHGARFDHQHALHSTEHKIELHNSHDYEHVP